MTKNAYILVLALAAIAPACAIINGISGNGDDEGGGTPDFEENCFDDGDDDNDGRTDCTDNDCSFDSICDGLVDCDGDPIPGSCRCISDSACDGFSGFICHFGADPGPSGVCGPDCRNDDWCFPVGLSCGLDGRCNGGVPPDTELQCLDGTDDDGDAFTDCEDSDCQVTSVCDAFDSCANNPFFDGACACRNDSGCQALSSQFKCHTDAVGPGVGACGTDCRNLDWCQNVGLICDFGIGVCGNGMPTSDGGLPPPDGGSPTPDGGGA